MPQPLPPDPDEIGFAALRQFAVSNFPLSGRLKSVTFHFKAGDQRVKVPDVAAAPPPVPPTPEATPELPPRRAGPDFRSINWDGHFYPFSKTQAKVVALLWAAWEDGLADVSLEHLRTKAGVDTARLSELFRDSTAWEKVIFHGSTQGTLRLGHPSEDSQPAENP